jgi:DNA-binding CsgD family transcriptional regulator
MFAFCALSWHHVGMQSYEKMNTRLVPGDPALIVYHDAPKLHEGNIFGIAIGTGKVRVDPSKCDLTQIQMSCAVLASLGMDTSEMAVSLYRSEDTIKDHVGRGLEKLGIKSRTGFFRAFLDIQAYKVVEKGKELGLTSVEKDVIDLTSQGHTNQAIANELKLTSNEIKLHQRHISGAARLNGREAASMLALVSGEIGDYIRDPITRT